MRSENIKIVEEGINKIEEGNVVKKIACFFWTILIDFCQIAVYLTLFVLTGISCLILLLAIISRVFNHLILAKVARYSFSGSIPPTFERKLRRHKQRFGKTDTTVVLDKDENLL